MYQAVISIGSNCGDKRENVYSALKWIASSDKMSLCASSEIYETPEIHGRDVIYMNAVASLSTEMELDELITLFKAYELSSGRDLLCRLEDRVPIDIDVVTWNDEIIRPKDFESSFFTIGLKDIML